MSDDTRTIKGLSELQKFLDQLPIKLQANIMRGALRAGGQVIVGLARGNIQSRSGDLARSIRVTGGRATRGKVVMRVVAGGKKAEMGNRPIWVEYGTKPHLVSVSDKDRPVNVGASMRAGRVVRTSVKTINKALGSLKIGGKFVGPVVRHPGARPQPFMRPAMDTGATAAVLAVAAYVKKRLNKEGLNAYGVEVSVDDGA